MKLWFNLYRQGWYHREGKPDTMRFHPGDLYPSQEHAVADIDRSAPYIGTFSFELTMSDTYWLAQEWGTKMLMPYPKDSVPASLKDSRAAFGSLETSEREASEPPPGYRVPSHIVGLRSLAEGSDL